MQILFMVAAVWAADVYERQTFTASSGLKVPYRIMLPENYDPKKIYPLVVWLHGKGERGTNNESQLAHGAERLAEPAVRAKLPAIVVVPQCPEDDKWTTMSSALAPGQQKLAPFPTPITRASFELVASLQKRYGVDGKRTALVGVSMGAFGVMDWLARKPDMFSSGLAMSGGGATDTAATLAQSRLWLMHGRKDSMVDFEQSVKVAEAVRKAGGDPKLTLLEDRDHGKWDDLAVRPDVLSWLLNEQRPIVIASPKEDPASAR